MFGFMKTLQVTDSLKELPRGDEIYDLVFEGNRGYYSRGTRENMANPLIYQESENLFDENFDSEKIKRLFNDLPILKKEYNPDGTRKNAVQMIHERDAEYAKLLEWKNRGQITAEEYQELHDDSRDMYVGLIYKTMEQIMNSSLTNDGQTVKFSKESIKELLAIDSADSTIFAEMVEYFKSGQSKCEIITDEKTKSEIKKYYQDRIDNITGIRDGLKRLKARDIRQSFQNKGITTSEQNSAMQSLRARNISQSKGQSPNR